MSARAFLIESAPAGVYAQMALDEAMLEGLDAPALRFYRWAGPPGATFGYFQSFREVSLAVRERLGPLALAARRPTGGGLVYHDGDVTFSFVFPWPRLVSPALVYKNIHLGVHLGLKALRLASRLWSWPGPAPGPASARPAPGQECFLGPEPMDLVHEDGRKCLGGALRRRRAVGLYQGSLRPEGFPAAPARLAEGVREGLALQWRLLFERRASAGALDEAARRLLRERYETEDWNRRR